jgi:hypothetical protein
MRVREPLSTWQRMARGAYAITILVGISMAICASTSVLTWPHATVIYCPLLAVASVIGIAANREHLGRRR